MSVNIVPNVIPNDYKGFNYSGNIPNDLKPRIYQNHKQASTKVKTGVMLTTLAGIAATMAVAFKLKKIPFNSPSKFFKALTTVNYKDGEVEKLISGLAIGSVGGGLLGGAIFDKKENFKAKCREAIIQLVGNIFTPLICVLGGGHIFKSLEKQYPSILIEGAKKTKALKAVALAVSLGIGIILGNKTGNAINKKAFGCDEQRKIKATDMTPHIDDLCFAVSILAKEIKFIPRLIPLAFVIAGFSTGTAQETPKMLYKEAVKKILSEEKKETQSQNINKLNTTEKQA